MGFALASLLLVACAPPSDAERYARALSAEAYDGAWAECVAIAGASDRSDCQQNVAGKFARFDGCDAITEETWREECRFAEAEHLARAGDRAAAADVCGQTRYARNCQSHVLDGLAMEQHARTVPEAAAALAPLAPHLAAEQVQSEFWSGYFRIRIERALPVDTAECADRWCLAGARRAMWAVVAPLRRANPSGAPPMFSWATSESARREIERAWNEPPPGPPPGAPRSPNATGTRAPIPPASATAVGVEPAEQTE